MNLGMLRGFGGSVRGYRRGPVQSMLATYQVSGNVPSFAANARAVSVLSGATTTGSLKRALRVQGRGCIDFAAISCVDATSRTLRLVITVDGRRFIDTTSAAIAATNNGFIALGNYISGGGVLASSLEPIEFQRELIIQFASSVAAETDKVQIHYKVEVWAP